MNQFERRSMCSKSVVPNSYLNGYTCSQAVENVSTWSHRPTCSFAIYHQLYIYTIIRSYNKLYAYINHGYQIHSIFFGFVQRWCCFAIIAPWQDCFTFLPSYRVSNSKSFQEMGMDDFLVRYTWTSSPDLSYLSHSTYIKGTEYHTKINCIIWCFQGLAFSSCLHSIRGRSCWGTPNGEASHHF